MKTRIWTPIGVVITLLGGGAHAQTFEGFQRRGINFRINTFAFTPAATLARMSGMAVPTAFGQATGFNPLPSQINAFPIGLITSANDGFVNSAAGNGFNAVTPGVVGQIDNRDGFITINGVTYRAPGGAATPSSVVPAAAGLSGGFTTINPFNGVITVTPGFVTGRGVIPPPGLATPFGFGSVNNGFNGFGPSNVFGRGVVPPAPGLVPMARFR